MLKENAENITRWLFDVPVGQKALPHHVKRLLANPIGEVSRDNVLQEVAVLHKGVPEEPYAYYHISMPWFFKVRAAMDYYWMVLLIFFIVELSKDFKKGCERNY